MQCINIDLVLRAQNLYTAFYFSRSEKIICVIPFIALKSVISIASIFVIQFVIRNLPL